MQVPARRPACRAIVVGAGFGGLSAAILLCAAGVRVTLLDQHYWVGGKARRVASDAGPVDAGPTVLTLRHVFDALFQATDARLDDCVSLMREPLLARHFWPDGSQLDLFDDRAQSAAAIEAFAGARSAREFAQFAAEAEALFKAFDQPMMQQPEPALSKLAISGLTVPQHLPSLSPLATLSRKLARRFSDPRLRQLFGRYATYVGGLPQRAPALLSLIWRAEEAGVWRVSGGMAALAQALARRFEDCGGTLRLGQRVERLLVTSDRVTGLRLASGETIPADIVVFNGDPRALATGLLGPSVASVARTTTQAARSLSARVWSFAARAHGAPLAHHSVFFAANPTSEFSDLARGQTPDEPTLYVCAQDRRSDAAVPEGLERFEIILNAPPLDNTATDATEVNRCRQLTFPTLARFGLTFAPDPPDEALTTPQMFDTFFPGSAGSLYGQSPHGMMAALKRPRARTPIAGLYLAGGGTHPGAGVPMAALSGRHAAAAIMQDLALT